MDRGRDMERSIDADYLRLLDSYYQEWMVGFDLCPVLSIRTDDLDFVHQPQHLEIVIDRIRDKLLGREEIEFPAE